MGLFSTKKITTTTQQVSNAYDQRTGADSGSVAVGPGASLTYNQEFSDNAFKVVDRLGAIFEKSIDQNSNQIGQLNSNTQQILGQLLERQDRTEKGDKTIFTDIFPFAAIAIVGAVTVLVFTKGKS